MHKLFLATALDVEIRRAGACDAPALAALFRMVYKDSSHPFQTADAIVAFLADPSNFQIVAEDSGQLIASMAMAYNPWNDSYELGRALTRAEHRRHGLAAYLIQAVVDYAADGVLGEVIFGFPRVQRIVDLCAVLNPRMIVVGHDAGRNVANGGRETHAIVCGILRRERFVHLAPPTGEFLQSQFVVQRIYAPLGLGGSPGQYPDECFIGNTSQGGAQDFDGWIFDYTKAGNTLEIVGGQSWTKPAQVGDCLDRLLARVAGVEHVAATVLADKVPMIRALAASGFEITAYLPAWHKVGQFRYDCVQLARRLYVDRPRYQDFEALLTGLDSEFQSRLFLQGPDFRQAVAAASSI
jgi:RimJ/RimL family protein N-acetyltransferase